MPVRCFALWRQPKRAGGQWEKKGKGEKREKKRGPDRIFCILRYALYALGGGPGTASSLLWGKIRRKKK